MYSAVWIKECDRRSLGETDSGQQQRRKTSCAYTQSVAMQTINSSTADKPHDAFTPIKWRGWQINTPLHVLPCQIWSQTTLNDQGWAQSSFVEAEARQGSNSLTEARQGRESSRQRRGRLNSREGRGEATPKKPPFPYIDVQQCQIWSL